MIAATRRLVMALPFALGLGGVALARTPRLSSAPTLRWAIDYGATTDPLIAARYDLLVLEPDHPRPIAPLRAKGGTLLGYLSLGEVEKGRPFAAALDRAGALLAPNPNWPDARLADLRHPAWRAQVLDRLAPAILAQGYDGVFLDTLDNAEALERQDPKANAGMVAAAASLVEAMRARFGDAVIVMNRGYALLPRVAPAIDGVLGEAMASRWNFAERSYERVPDSDWTWQAERLRDARAHNRTLALLTLDYWPPEDPEAVAALYERERTAGFAPYVAVLALDRIVTEPTP